MPAASMENIEEWTADVDDVSAQIKGIIDGTITDFDELDRKMNLKERTKQIREEELKLRRERFFLQGFEGKGEGSRYKWWCKRCFVEYSIDLPENHCTRCKKDDKMMTQEQRREELMGKLDDFKEKKAKHQFRKDKWVRWKKSQALLKRSKYINYKAWEYWEPDTESEEEGDPIVPRHNPEFIAMEADMKARNKKQLERSKTSRKCRERGNICMRDGDFVGAIESYEEGLEYRRDDKALWTNKALAETKMYRWHDAIASCNKVIEYSEIFEDGFTKSADACFKAFTRRAIALRALHRWDEAVEDLKDAAKLFPKDKEARDLLEKTKAASEEASGGQPPPPQAEAAANAGDNEATPVVGPAAKSAPAAPAPKVPVRVAIAESDSESEGEAAQATRAPASGGASAVAAASSQEFAALVKRLERDQQERVRFCQRGVATAVLPARRQRDEGRKLDIRVEEVVEPSKLDLVLKDVERCAILWKKKQGRTVPSHLKLPAHEPEEQENDAFLEKVTPRVLQVVLLLATHSDNHCERSSSAIRHVWPLLSSPTWRYTGLALLMEWSQRSVSAKALAEFAGRHPDPHVHLLVEAVAQETKENLLPPGFEERTKEAAERLETGDLDVETALEDMMQGLSKPSASELAVGTLGNMLSAGVLLPVFKAELVQYCDEIVVALKHRLKSLDWRLCGRAAGALCNLVRLGDTFSAAVQEQCTEALVAVLRDELSDGTKSVSSFARGLQSMGAGGVGMPHDVSRGRVLSALLNLLVVRPVAAAPMLSLGVLELVIPLIDPAANTRAAGVVDDATPLEMANRATTIASKLVAASPSCLTKQPELEAELLRRLFGVLHRCGNFKAVKATAHGDDGAMPALQLESLELSVRLLTTVLQKTPGAMARFLDAPAGSSAGAATPGEAWSVVELVPCLLRLTLALRPRVYIQPDEEGNVHSRLRGNLCLILGNIAELQAREDAPAVVLALDLSSLVEPLVDTLRKERAKAQYNIGVCVTRLAQNPRYRQLVRDHNGLETLHQVQMPRVQAQKEVAMRLHRQQGPPALPDLD